MGMPITIEIVDTNVTNFQINSVFNYFTYVDKKFSTYKPDSEISLINQGKIKRKHYSQDMKQIFNLALKTKKQTQGYFDIKRDQGYDPSGIVKGWAILQASKLLQRNGFKNFYINAGGDIQSLGKNNNNQPWSVGIQHPFNPREIIKVIFPKNHGVATSGTYERGQHILNPLTNHQLQSDIISLTIIGPDIFEADRFATAAFAMGQAGISFIESLPNLEGYMINRRGIATFTSGFEKFTKQ